MTLALGDLNIACPFGHPFTIRHDYRANCYLCSNIRHTTYYHCTECMQGVCINCLHGASGPDGQRRVPLIMMQSAERNNPSVVQAQ